MKHTGPNDIVTLAEGESVAYVTLNRPDVHNAFDENMIAHLAMVFDELAGRDDICAVVLRGQGKSFSAGGDINWMKRAAGYSEDENYQDGLKLAAMLHGLYTLPQVTIACVHGPAMGGGMGLAACCDIVLAGPGAVFALSEVKLGLIPATIGPYVMAAIGPRQMRRYAQSGERIDADTALQIGLAHAVGDIDVLLDDVLKNIHANGPLAMRAAKTLCADLAGAAITPALIDDTARRIAKTRAGDEAKEGLVAFLEKRKAGWVC